MRASRRASDHRQNISSTGMIASPATLGTIAGVGKDWYGWVEQYCRRQSAGDALPYEFRQHLHAGNRHSRSKRVEFTTSSPPERRRPACRRPAAHPIMVRWLDLLAFMPWSGRARTLCADGNGGNPRQFCRWHAGRHLLRHRRRPFPVATHQTMRHCVPSPVSHWRERSAARPSAEAPRKATGSAAWKARFSVPAGRGRRHLQRDLGTLGGPTERDYHGWKLRRAKELNSHRGGSLRWRFLRRPADGHFQLWSLSIPPLHGGNKSGTNLPHESHPH